MMLMNNIHFFFSELLVQVYLAFVTPLKFLKLH